jgi:hypothetical protein
VIWLLTRVIVWPARSAAFAAATGYRAGRLLGYRRLTYIALGVGIGLLVAPIPGRELRRRIEERFAADPLPPYPDPDALVSDRLAGAP